MDSKQSCRYRETLWGIRVDRGVFVFAIINAIIVSVATIGCIVFFGMMLYIRLHPEYLHRDSRDLFAILFSIIESMFFYMLFIVSIISLVGVAIADLFAAVLYVGITERKPKYLQAYFIYGVINLIFSVLGGLYFTLTSAISSGRWDMALGGSAALGICVIYVLPLCMVQHTYMMLSDAPEGHKKLINERDDIPLY